MASLVLKPVIYAADAATSLVQTSVCVAGAAAGLTDYALEQYLSIWPGGPWVAKKLSIGYISHYLDTKSNIPGEQCSAGAPTSDVKNGAPSVMKPVAYVSDTAASLVNSGLHAAGAAVGLAKSALVQYLRLWPGGGLLVKQLGLADTAAAPATATINSDFYSDSRVLLETKLDAPAADDGATAPAAAPAMEVCAVTPTVEVQSHALELLDDTNITTHLSLDAAALGEHEGQGYLLVPEAPVEGELDMGPGGLLPLPYEQEFASPTTVPELDQAARRSPHTAKAAAATQGMEDWSPAPRADGSAVPSAPASIASTDTDTDTAMGHDERRARRRGLRLPFFGKNKGRQGVSAPNSPARSIDGAHEP